MAIELLTEGRPIGQLRASRPKAPGLAQAGLPAHPPHTSGSALRQ
jgi:hypothetical protein